MICEFCLNNFYQHLGWKALAVKITYCGFNIVIKSRHAMANCFIRGTLLKCSLFRDCRQWCQFNIYILNICILMIRLYHTLHLVAICIIFNKCKSHFSHALCSLSLVLIDLLSSSVSVRLLIFSSHISSTHPVCFSLPQSVTGAVTPAAVPCVVTVCSAWRDTSCRMAFVCQAVPRDTTKMLRDAWVSDQK